MPCFRYHDRWKSLGLYDFIPPFTVENSYQSKFMGYVFHEKVAPSPAEDIEKHMQYTSDAEPVVQWNRIFINRIADLCSKNDIKLVLISMPNTKAWDMKRHNGVDNIARELGCEYIDLNLLNEEIGIDWQTDTSDNGEHMNYPGALKVTRYLTRYLEQTGILTDHRSDPHYSDWDNHLRTYEKYLKKRERSAATQDDIEKA